MISLKKKFNLQIRDSDSNFISLSNIEKIDLKIVRNAVIKKELMAYPWSFYSEYDKNIEIVMNLHYIVSEYNSEGEVSFHEILFEKIFNKIESEQTIEFKLTLPINKSIISNFYVTSYELGMLLNNFNRGFVTMHSSGVPILSIDN